MIRDRAAAIIAAVLIAAVDAEPASAAQREEAGDAAVVSLSAGQLFELADAAVARGDHRTAEAAYRALEQDPDPRTRREARFRLAALETQRGNLVAAATLLRAILDEEPTAQRVRLELARLLDMMGDEAGARRALREAQAGGLPPDVALVVDRYSAALRARRPYGASIEVAIAPDTNINRATRSDTLGTIFGDFELDEAAREKSGIGLALRGQAYRRLQLSEDMALLGRVSGSADLYRESDFNDQSLSLRAGPEWRLGEDRLSAEAGIEQRWYGGRALSRQAFLGATYLHPLNRVSQLRVGFQVGLTDHRLNDFQDSTNLSANALYERALSPRTGLAASLALFRETAEDPGYSTTGGQIAVLGYRDFGAMTLSPSLSYSRSEADRRLFIYPERRRDEQFRFSLAASFRRFTFRGFAPLVRLTAEFNRSSIELFDYRRLRTEIGLVRAF